MLSRTLPFVGCFNRISTGNATGAQIDYSLQMKTVNDKTSSFRSKGEMPIANFIGDLRRNTSCVRIRGTGAYVIIVARRRQTKEKDSRAIETEEANKDIAGNLLCRFD